MAVTDVSICNLALTYIGAATITALADDTTSGRACNLLYADCLDFILRQHPWNFAIKRVSIAVDATAPIFEFDNAFALPADSLRILKVNTTYRWEIEAGFIVTDAATPLEVKYIKQETDETLFDMLFVKAFSAYLAYQMAEQITQSNTKIKAAYAWYQECISKAKTVDAQEGTPRTLLDGAWLDSRW